MSERLDCMNRGHTQQLAWLHSSNLTACLECSLRVPLLVWFRTWLRKKMPSWEHGCQGSPEPGLEHEAPVDPALPGLECLQQQRWIILSVTKKYVLRIWAIVSFLQQKRNVQHICHYFFLEMPPPIVKFNINGPILISNCKNRMPTEANDIQLSNNVTS